MPSIMGWPHPGLGAGVTRGTMATSSRRGDMVGTGAEQSWCQGVETNKITTLISCLDQDT